MWQNVSDNTSESVGMQDVNESESDFQWAHNIPPVTCRCFMFRLRLHYNNFHMYLRWHSCCCHVKANLFNLPWFFNTLFIEVYLNQSNCVMLISASAQVQLWTLWLNHIRSNATSQNGIERVRKCCPLKTNGSQQFLFYRQLCTSLSQICTFRIFWAIFLQTRTL